MKSKEHSVDSVLSSIFLPEDISKVNSLSIFEWYRNIEKELAAGIYSKEEKNHIIAYYSDAGLLRKEKRNYFRHHFADAFLRASKYLLLEGSASKILDLGCGVGTQSLFFALLGAQVTAIDMDSVALSVLKKRKEYYSNILGLPLNINIIEENTFNFDYSTISPIDGIYSMFAFNMMQPSDDILNVILPSASKTVRIAVQDGNCVSLYSKLKKSRRRNWWTPGQFNNALRDRGFRIDYHAGSIACPPVMWNLFPYDFVKKLDAILINNWLLPISQLILAQKTIRN